LNKVGEKYVDEMKLIEQLSNIKEEEYEIKENH